LRAQLRSSALEHMALLEHLKNTGQESASLNAATAAMQLKCARLRKAYPECAAQLGSGSGAGGSGAAEKDGGGREGRVSSGKASETALQEDEEDDEEEEEEVEEAAQAVRGSGWMGGMSPSAQAHNHAITPGGSSGLSAGFGVHTMAEAAAAASAHANAAAAAILGYKT